MNFNLNYEGFMEYLVEKKVDRELNGVQYIFRFENGYGASVIKSRYSYGHADDLWELAVIKYETPITNDIDVWDLCYDTPITDDVLGSLSDSEVRDILGQIKELKGE